MGAEHQPGQPTLLEVAQAIESMRDLLFRTYGLDFAFCVTGRGAVLASHTPHGVIEAVTK